MTKSVKCGNQTFMIVTKITFSENLNRTLPFPMPEEFTAIRKEHWHNSRLALSDCLQELGHKVECSEDLIVVDHHHLKGHPDTLVSLTHTRGAAGACAIKATKDVLGVGIDLEPIEREIKGEWKSKFLLPTDSGESDLHLWCAKEAAFKASSYFWNQEKTFVLKDIQLKGNKFEIPHLLEGKFKISREGNYLCTVAWVTKILDS